MLSLENWIGTVLDPSSLTSVALTQLSLALGPNLSPEPRVLWTVTG